MEAEPAWPRGIENRGGGGKEEREKGSSPREGDGTVDRRRDSDG